MNKVIMMGRLTRDPEVRVSTGSGNTVIGRFSIAVDRRFKKEGQPEADFFNCIAFGKQGEFVEKYLHKGTKVVITGALQNDDYTNKDGQKVRNVQIVVDELEFAESKAASERNVSQPAPAPQNGDDGFMDVPDGIEEDLPFN